MTHHYIAIVHKDQNSAYGVTFPDLDGVFSAADSYEDVRANAQEALDLAFEDVAELPKQRSIDELRKDPEVKRQLAEGAALFDIRYIRNENKVVRTNVTFDKGMLRAIDAEAAERSLTRSAFLAEAARAMIAD